MKNLRASAPLRLKKYPAYKHSGIEWLGNIPADWKVKRLRFVIKTNPVKSEIRGLNNLDLVSFLPMEAVGEYGGLALVAEKTLEEVSSGYTYFQDGDVVVAKITPCFENGKGSLAEGLTNSIGFGTTELHVLRPKSDIDGRYLFYLSISHPFRKLGEFEMYGAGGQKRVPEDYIRNFRPSIPPLFEQKSIASFLDRKTTEIDALIAKKRRMIELLQEKRTAVISHAVTKGLDPSAPMKDSGVEWLGKVPRHWEILKLKRIVAMKSGENITADQIDDSGEFPVFGGNGLRGYTDNYTHEGCYVLIGRQGALCGNVNYAEGKFWASEHAVVVRPRKQLVIKWLGELLRAMYLNQYSVSAAQPGLSVDTIGNLGIPYPPLEEQQSIAIHLDHEINKINSLVEKIESAIDKLLEYRSALISAAVTGKIDVREDAA